VSTKPGIRNEEPVFACNGDEVLGPVLLLVPFPLPPPTIIVGWAVGATTGTVVALVITTYVLELTTVVLPVRPGSALLTGTSVVPPAVPITTAALPEMEVGVPGSGVGGDGNGTMDAEVTAPPAPFASVFVALTGIVVWNETRTFVAPEIKVVRPTGAEEPGTRGTVAMPEMTIAEESAMSVGDGSWERPSWEAIAEAIGFGFGDGFGEGFCTVGTTTAAVAEGL
jgi:hypothetical protein